MFEEFYQQPHEPTRTSASLEVKVRGVSEEDTE